MAKLGTTAAKMDCNLFDLVAVLILNRVNHGSG